MADSTLLATGTWMIGFDRDKGLASLDENLGMVSNVDVDGNPVSSTITMAGREYAQLAGDAPMAPEGEVLEAAARLIHRKTFALPSFVGNDGLFPGSSGKGRMIGPPPETAGEIRAMAALYIAFQAHKCLDALESQGKPVIIDGGLAANSAFARLLAALRPSQKIFTSQSVDGTALGAAAVVAADGTAAKGRKRPYGRDGACAYSGAGTGGTGVGEDGRSRLKKKGGRLPQASPVFTRNVRSIEQHKHQKPLRRVNASGGYLAPV